MASIEQGQKTNNGQEKPSVLSAFLVVAGTVTSFVAMIAINALTKGKNPPSPRP